MLERIIKLLSLWSSKEPSASLLMFATCLLIFVSLLAFNNKEKITESQLYINKIFYALTQSIWFVLILGVMYFLLNTSSAIFTPLANSITKDEEVTQEVLDARKIWGGSIKQNELEVNFSYKEIGVKEIKIGDKISYINNTYTKTIEQESIIKFEGVVDIEIENPDVNAYTAKTNFKYQILNSSDKTLKADFRFPIDQRRHYENVKVFVNSREIPFEVYSNYLSWNNNMNPSQTDIVEIIYTVRGMNSFVYSIPVKRSINNFFLSMSINIENIIVLAKPGGNAIEVNNEKIENGRNVTWHINTALMSSQLGIYTKSPEPITSTQLQAIAVVLYAKSGLMIYGILIAMTLIIMRERINMWDFSLMMITYSSQYLGIIGFDLIKVDYWISILVFAIIVCLIARKIFVKLSKPTYIATFAITIIFSFGYPFAGLLEKGRPRDTFEIFLYLAVLMYLFFSTLIVRIKNKN